MTRYPLSRLLALMGGNLSEKYRTLRISGSTVQDYRRNGVSARVADSLAVRAGFDPYVVWPELLDDAIAAEERECAAPDCTVRFVPGPKAGKKRFCSRTCYMRVSERLRYRANPEPKRARQREYDQLVRDAKARRRAA